MKKLFSFVVLFLLLFVFSCKKKARSVSENPVPSVPVDMTIYPNDPFYSKIQSIGGWVYKDGGLNGIIIYRKTEQEFVAIERSSSQLPSNPKARVYVMSDNFSLIDSVSGSRWRIFDGTVTKGPAEWPLRLYGTNFDNNVLIIRN